MAAPKIAGWPALMGRELAALYLDMSTRKVDQLQALGKLIPVKSDAGKRFSVEELNRYIASLPDWGEEGA